MQWKRVIAITVWTFVAFWSWLLAIALGARLMIYGQEIYGWSRPPEWTLPLLLYGVMGFGTLFLTVATLMLGLRGKLPGTRKPGEQAHGFPVEVSGPSAAA
ncbi:MAG TPA: hypothetical protein VF669_10095 [Tepidisphaeraceae bacterium]|jgi:hypothetical protein